MCTLRCDACLRLVRSVGQGIKVIKRAKLSVHKSVLLRYGLGARGTHGIRCTHDARARARQSEAHTAALYPVTIRLANVSREHDEKEGTLLSPAGSSPILVRVPRLNPTSWEGRVGGDGEKGNGTEGEKKNAQ